MINLLKVYMDLLYPPVIVSSAMEMFYPVRFAYLCQKCKTDVQSLITDDLTIPKIRRLLETIKDKVIFNLKKH